MDASKEKANTVSLKMPGFWFLWNLKFFFSVKKITYSKGFGDRGEDAQGLGG
jgi:hypothetical protein